MKINEKYHNMSTKELSKELIRTVYQTFKVIISFILAIIISFKLGSIISSIEIFDNSPVLFWFVVLFVFTSIWIVCLILINYVQTLVYRKRR